MTCETASSALLQPVSRTTRSGGSRGPYPGLILPAATIRAFPAVSAFLYDPKVDTKNKLVVVGLIQVCPLSAVRVYKDILHRVATASVGLLPVCHHPFLILGEV